ncbi:Qat anti-phage system associated protein QatB [Thalassospira tepidiphila]|uniref:Qat anti-phage system associated protein QatB n=1 Tax=Thalassospira tepidiphila TaxID=393657 RepID=UPI003AA9526B
MGTSTSSAGAGAGTSFDPPWLDDAGDSIDTGCADTPLSPSTDPSDDADGDKSEGDDENQATPPAGPPIAPPGRYQQARGALTGFIRSGSDSDLRRGISSFVKKGMGGASRAGSRMRTSAIAASSLGGFLATARDATDPSINAWVDSIKQRGLSAKNTALEVVQRLIPSGGSVDEESAKHAMDNAIAHLYEMDPATDIFNLTDDQIASLMAYTVAFDVYNRVQLELGRVFEKLKYAPQLVQNRLGQVLDYIIVVVNRSMEKVRAGGVERPMRDIANAALRDALTVFAES